jgi:hypothetical protein
VLRCFIVPRGIALIAGGSAEADASAFELAAELDSPTYGICSNRFLDREFKTVRYALKFEQRDANTIHYWEDTVIQLEGVKELFHHTDENTLIRKA